MRKHGRARVYVAAAIAALTFGMTGTTASAALLASDNASDPAYNGGWNSGTNGGTGWGGGWVFRNGANVVQNSPSGSFFGRFIGSSTNNNAGGGDTNSDGDINTAGNEAWGLYANTANEIYAVRPLSGALSVGQTISFEFDNGNIDNTRVLGVRLLSNASDINTRQMEVRFVGGDSNYTVVSTPNHTTTHGFSREGILAEFTLTAATTYSLKLTRLQTGATQTVTGSILSPGGSNAINGIAFRNLAAGSGGNFDGYFNSIAVTPEPVALTLLAPALALLAPRRRRA